MATTINSGYANSPKLTANIADHADVYGGRALVFDGVVDYLDCGDIDTSGNFSFSCWFNADSVTGHHMIFSMSDQSTSDGMSCGFYSGKGGKIYATANHGSTSSTKITSVLSTGQWYHLVVTKSSGQTENIYINGASDTNSADSNWGLADETIIGARNAGSNFLFNGKISDVKLFNSILTEAQVQELYKKPENTPSAVQDNLVAWYPMIEGNPESPQSIVYDHSEKGLRSELVDNFTESAFSTIYGSTVTNITDGVQIADDSSNSDIGYFTDASLLNRDLVGTEFIKVQFYAFHNNVGNPQVRVNNGGVNTDITITSSNALYTVYVNTNSNGFIRTRNNSTGSVTTITNLSLKPVLMGNHATTNFFGDDLVTNGTFDADSNWTKGTGWSIGSGVASCDGTQTGNTSLLQTNLFTVGKTYQITFDLTRTAGNFRLLVGSTGSSGYYTTDDTHTYTRVATGNGHLYLQGDEDFIGTVNKIRLAFIFFKRGYGETKCSRISNPVTKSTSSGILSRDDKYSFTYIQCNQWRGPGLSMATAFTMA